MKPKILILTVFLLIVFTDLRNTSAQFSFGAGIAGLKYLGSGSNRPMALGINTNIGIELSEKTQLLLSPTYYVPVTYSYNETFNISNVPTVTKTDEQFKTLQMTALFEMYIIGNNKAGGLYAAVGPSVALYNTKVTRENYTTYDYAADFKDYILDGRVGIEIPLGLLRLYAEGEIGPAIVSDIKTNNVYYTPNKGTILAGIVGLRIRI